MAVVERLNRAWRRVQEELNIADRAHVARSRELNEAQAAEARGEALRYAGVQAADAAPIAEIEEKATAAHREVTRLEKVSEAISAEMGGARFELQFAEVRRTAALMAYLPQCPEVQKLVDQLNEVRERKATLEAVLGAIPGSFDLKWQAEPLNLGPDWSQVDLWRAAIELLAENADAELPGDNDAGRERTDGDARAAAD